MASTTTHFAKVCSLYLVAWTLKNRTGNSFAYFLNPAPNLSSHSRHALPTCRRAPSLVFPTDLQLDLAVDHFISGLRDASSRDYLRRERARRRIIWQEAVQMAQVSKVSRAAKYTSPAAAVSLDAMCAMTLNFAHSTTSFPNNCAISPQAYHGNIGNSQSQELSNTYATPTKTRVLRPLTSRHMPIVLTHRKPNEPLTLATEFVFVHISNYT